MKKPSAITPNNLVTFVFCMLLGAFIFTATSGYPTVQGQGFGRGPAFYPRVLGGLMITFGMLTLIQDLRRARGRAPADPGTEGTAPSVSYRPVAAFLILCAASIYAIKYLGFLFCGFLLAFFSTLMIRASFKVADAIRALFFSLGLMVVVYLLFEVFVGIQLPGSALFK